LVVYCVLTVGRAYPFLGDIIAILLANRFISPNAAYPPGSGTTPLHLAASEGRVDVVDLLLDQEEIDDSLLDANGKSCKDVAKGKGVVKAIQGTYSPGLLQRTPRNETVGYRISPPAPIQTLDRFSTPHTVHSSGLTSILLHKQRTARPTPTLNIRPSP
jgi:hypothetical protein